MTKERGTRQRRLAYLSTFGWLLSSGGLVMTIEARTTWGRILYALLTLRSVAATTSFESEYWHRRQGGWVDPGPGPRIDRLSQ